MKITKDYLKRVIKEELERVMSEQEDAELAFGRALLPVLDNSGLSLSSFAYGWVPAILRGQSVTRNQAVVDGVKAAIQKYASDVDSNNIGKFAANALEKAQNATNKEADDEWYSKANIAQQMTGQGRPAKIAR